jgi:hypothetical protein
MFKNWVPFLQLNLHYRDYIVTAVSDIIAVYCENHTNHTHTLYRQNAVSGVETDGTYSYPCFLES